MMLLGKVIKLAMTAQSDFPDDVIVREPEFVPLLSAEAELAGMDVPRFVADTVSRFMAYEDGESWTTIVSNIQRTDDPGKQRSSGPGLNRAPTGRKEKVSSNIQRTDDPGYAFISTIMHARVDHHCEQHEGHEHHHDHPRAHGAAG